MKYLIIALLCVLSVACTMPQDDPPPTEPTVLTVTSTVTTTIGTPTVTVTSSSTAPEKVFGPEYASFDGKFSYVDGRGFSVFVEFIGDKADVMTLTANALVYSRCTFVLVNGTISTYKGIYPIIWYFECVDYPYVWQDADTLIVTDPVNNRVLTLRRR